ncbi:hypothetical protein HMPREF1549_01583 [Actinomyces johnsonii F0510]|uniref:Uncharacterized protein n=1 Tax=Actinomyces johnsonii F0510 TaxID=1227262 RepID=U1QAA2_9ACTO|nr:hypothetical protein HMPREF1549_01583 [Actinomyces johnsonii F0510]
MAAGADSVADHRSTDRRRRSGAITADKPHEASTALKYGGTVGSDGSDADLGNSHDALNNRYLNSTCSALTSALTRFGSRRRSTVDTECEFKPNLSGNTSRTAGIDRDNSPPI